MNINWHQVGEVLASTAARIAIIVVVSTLVVLLLRLIIKRIVQRLSRVKQPHIQLSRIHEIRLGRQERLPQRLRTFQSVVNSAITLVVGLIAFVMIISELGVNIAPLLASAGVAGVALAFGAQSIVQDAFSGIFILVEDQYGVGDRVELGTAGVVLAAGVVESVALRITTVRDDDGKLWYVRNGEIVRVSNHSQGWSQAHALLRLPSEADLTIVRDALRDLTNKLRDDSTLAPSILSDADVNVEDISASAVTIRWQVRTVSGRQAEVASAFKRQVIPTLAQHNIRLAE